MAISANNLLIDEDNSNLTIYTTASVAPASNQLQLLTLYSADFLVEVPSSVVGNGLTWVLIGSVSLSQRTVALYRAMGASPSSGTIVITYPSEQDGLCWSLTEFGGDIDTTGSNGAGATNSDSNFATNSGSSVTSLTVTLASFSNSGNATFGGFGVAVSLPGNIVAGSGFALLGTPVGHGSPNQSHATEWRNDNDTSVDITGDNTNYVGVAIELFAAVAGGEEFLGRQYPQGVMRGVMRGAA